MTHLETVSIRYCVKRPVAEQLVQHGLFPCAPLRPTLVVDIFMLEWAITLFLHMALNVHAWTMTTEIMLKQEGYAFDTSDSLHCHFNNALMGQMVNAIPSPSQNQHCDDMIPPLPITLDESTPIDGRKYQNAHQPPTFSFNPKVPSNYLCSKCPCCFRSSFTLRSQLSAHCIISFDANFQLKHIKDYDWRFACTKPGFQDPEMMSPLTMEVSQVYAEGWKKKVEEVWQPACKAGIKWSVSHCDLENVVGKDKIMPGLKVTKETYDGCKQSFIAADEHCEKASKKYFDDTGIMAAVCRHGIPLLYVNVWTPREQQFYILSLLAKLFEHLPDMWMIGCLYDIGCQIDQALHKWDFFPLEWNSCLVWGVSIFHAYGHQWACQLWYHPWKDECWGLSDGEVCEQFWSGLCHLVPGLHVAGYHHWLFILDMQMEHIQKSKQSGLGEWLHSHLLNAKRHLEDTERGLGKHDVDQLLMQFKAQHRYHTKPLPQQSKNPG